MATVYVMNEFWPTIRSLQQHNAIKTRASLWGRRLFLYLQTVVFGIIRTHTRSRDLATYQTVFSNDSSCRNLIKVIRLIPRNNILTRSFSLGLLFFFFFRCTASFCHWQINRKYNIYYTARVDPIYPARSSKHSFAVPHIHIIIIIIMSTRSSLIL